MPVTDRFRVGALLIRLTLRDNDVASKVCFAASQFSSVHIITLESNLTGFAPLKVTALEALGNPLAS